MFERYTESARRAIFFSRYDAAIRNCSEIETEHLLMGISRDDQRVLDRVCGAGQHLRVFEHYQMFSLLKLERVSKTEVPDKGIRAWLSRVLTPVPVDPLSIDLPLGNANKRVLAYAAEEAERLNHRHIGSSHLLLGILRERMSPAAMFLTSLGVELDAARERVRDTE